MAQGSILVILPDPKLQSHYWREFSADGYSVTVAGGLDDAIKYLEKRTYDIIVFDVDEEIPGAALNHIAELKPRHGAPLVVQGSPETLVQVLAEFSQNKAEKSAFEADALVFKSVDCTELRITLQDLLSRRQQFSNNENSAAG